MSAASVALKVELIATVAVVVAIGVLAQVGWLSAEYAGIALGLATGSGVRSVVGSTTVPSAPPVASPVSPPTTNPPAV